MEAYIIEGAPDAGKSTLIYAQYLRLMNSNNYKLVESEYPHALTGFRLLIENIHTHECIYFNSPTDDGECIDLFQDFYLKYYTSYNIVKIVTSSRDNGNIRFKNRVLNFINGLNPSNTTTVCLTPLLDI